MQDAVQEYDVAIVGAGPAGSTVSTLLKKYAPEMRVVVLEKEHFPREHVGESQLPGISEILEEMGCWDKVEGANFPIKIGASYTWGRNHQLWDFDFYPAEEFKDEPRPARYDGQRRFTAFQVERSEYDRILAEHAASMGAEVRFGTKVSEVLCEDDRVEGLRLADGTLIRAKYYVDGSGTVGLIRRALGIETTAPKELRNIAVYSYWDNAEWAIRIGVGGTRVQVRSLPYGWIWFIPLGPRRASVGLICPADYYRDQKLSPEELYEKALDEQADIRALLAEAQQTESVRTAKDWSHNAKRLCGENWFLCGESGGFADPILAAGMTLAHTSARDVAYTIMELERGEHPRKWLLERYDERNRRHVDQHIQFAQYWYASNGCFTDLQEHCSRIAKEAGLRLSPSQAWRWLAQGGFANDFRAGQISFGSFDLGSSKQIIELFSGREAEYELTKYNVFKLNLTGAKKDFIGQLHEGRIEKVPCYRRGIKTLPITGLYESLMKMLERTSDGMTLIKAIQQNIAAKLPPEAQWHVFSQQVQVLEAMLFDGWVIGKHDKRRPGLKVSPGGGRLIRSNEEGLRALAERASQADAVG